MAYVLIHIGFLSLINRQRQIEPSHYRVGGSLCSKNYFFQTKALPVLSSQLDTEIPRYPPFLKELPAASPEDLQSTQDELIAKLRQILGFNQLEFQRLIQPCIDHLAAYVHLLPASEHHHSGPCGLLRHSLEVAF